MGMDVFGKAATTERGGYFRRSVWGWRPLADFILECAPAEAAGCLYWHSNDGAGLDAAGAARLAAKLADLQARGMVTAYVANRDRAINALPDEPCTLCDGTGVRRDEIGLSMGQPEKIISEAEHPRNGQRGWCNGCNGVGHKSPNASYYSLDADDVEEFRLFLIECGGFEIC